MLNKKVMFIAILLISLLSISAVSAADDAAIDENVLEESISDADLGDIQDDELGQGDGNALSDDGDPTPPPAPRWGVCECEPREDKNKVFGINVRVDEPRAEDYASRWAFERDHAKFDRLVDAAEACTWANKSNTAPLHKVNAIRKRIQDGPVFGRNLCGETHWF